LEEAPLEHRCTYPRLIRFVSRWVGRSPGHGGSWTSGERAVREEVLIPMGEASNQGRRPGQSRQKPP
jgi:hypothetical protein